MRGRDTYIFSSDLLVTESQRWDNLAGIQILHMFRSFFASRVFPRREMQTAALVMLTTSSCTLLPNASKLRSAAEVLEGCTLFLFTLYLFLVKSPSQRFFMLPKTSPKSSEFDSRPSNSAVSSSNTRPKLQPSFCPGNRFRS